MIDVDVSIAGIVMCCNESICNVKFGKGYKFEKCSFDSLPFKDKIINGKGQLDTNYFGSRIIENGSVFFICIKKDEKIQVSEPSIRGNIPYITDNEFMRKEELSKHMHIEMEYLNERINLLRLFKAGNIGFYDVFFHYNVRNFFNSGLDNSTHNQTRNTIENKCFSLEQSEISRCNQWLIDYCGVPYMLLKDSIDEFSWGMEQIDVPTGFEQYTTALEMTLLPQNQPGKKQMLANRISALLGTTDVEIQQIHKKILDFYRFRSESLHEGDGSNITKSELQELENITREV
ncbi:MAG: hypothetical protein LUH47_01625 [Clostridiales bacterium]|nr:hypothetical protein [Clostridiales bacterium]